jgi:hypothetical protein
MDQIPLILGGFPVERVHHGNRDEREGRQGSFAAFILSKAVAMAIPFRGRISSKISCPVVWGSFSFGGGPGWGHWESGA